MVTGASKLCVAFTIEVQQQVDACARSRDQTSDFISTLRINMNEEGDNAIPDVLNTLGYQGSIGASSLEANLLRQRYV